MSEICIKQIFITSEHQKEKDLIEKSGNTDVIVILSDGHKYTASFFTYAFIGQVRNRNRLTGEYLSGKYFWEHNMVLVEECTTEIIDPVVREIIDEGEFSSVFRRL
jgi:hypothetical protein